LQKTGIWIILLTLRGEVIDTTAVNFAIESGQGRREMGLAVYRKMTGRRYGDIEAVSKVSQWNTITVLFLVNSYIAKNRSGFNELPGIN